MPHTLTGWRIGIAAHGAGFAEWAVDAARYYDSDRAVLSAIAEFRRHSSGRLATGSRAGRLLTHKPRGSRARARLPSRRSQASSSAQLRGGRYRGGPRYTAGTIRGEPGRAHDARREGDEIAKGQLDPSHDHRARSVRRPLISRALAMPRFTGAPSWGASHPCYRTVSSDLWRPMFVAYRRPVGEKLPPLAAPDPSRIT